MRKNCYKLGCSYEFSNWRKNNYHYLGANLLTTGGRPRIDRILRKKDFFFIYYLNID